MADYDSDCDYDTKPRLEAKLGLGRIVSRLIDPFLVSITRIHGRSSGPRVSCPSFYAITSYANDIAYNNRASPTFVNNDGDEEEDEVPITVDRRSSFSHTPDSSIFTCTPVQSDQQGFLGLLGRVSQLKHGSRIILILNADHHLFEMILRLY